MGTHLIVLGESSPMSTNRVYMVFKNLYVLVLWRRVPSALEGLRAH